VAASGDGLPLNGPVPGVADAYVATGHSVWGILNAPATGEAMAELIVGGAAHGVDLEPFNPGRMRVGMMLARNGKFAHSLLEENGFENSVPREISSGFEASTELGPIDRRRGVSSEQSLASAKPIELVRRLKERPLTVE
jgi:hypothetical protein